jgi:hypothetical protein
VLIAAICVAHASDSGAKDTLAVKEMAPFRNAKMLMGSVRTFLHYPARIAKLRLKQIDKIPHPW